MRDFLKSLPPAAEFFVVIVVAFGVSIVSSLVLALHPGEGAVRSGTQLWTLVLHEIFVLMILGWFLRQREWSAARLGLKLHWSDGFIALGLAAGVYLVYYAAWYGLTLLSLPVTQAAHAASQSPAPIGLATLAAVVLVNPFFEELFVAGYVVAALKEKHGAIFAINVSVAIRLAYHLYLGVTGVIAVIPMGLVFGYWFARTNRLWPLVIAHAIMDLLGLIYYVKV